MLSAEKEFHVKFDIHKTEISASQEKLRAEINAVKTKISDEMKELQDKFHLLKFSKDNFEKELQIKVNEKMAQVDEVIAKRMEETGVQIENVQIQNRKTQQHLQGKLHVEVRKIKKT